MTQTPDWLVENILNAENIKTIYTLIESTQLDSQNLKEIIAQLAILHRDGEFQQKIVIDELENRNKLQEIQYLQIINKKDFYIELLHKKIGKQNKMLNKQNNNQVNSQLQDILIQKENQQQVEEILSLQYRVQNIEPLQQLQNSKQDETINLDQNDPMLDQLRKQLNCIQDESQSIWEESKRLLICLFQHEINKQQTILEQLIQLKALAENQISKYGDWLEKCKEQNQNYKILDQLKIISIYNSKIIRHLTNLVEDIIKNLQQILQQYNSTVAQQAQQIQIYNLLNQKVISDLEQKYKSTSVQNYEEFEKIAKQHIADFICSLSQSIFKEFKKFSVYFPNYLKPEAIINFIKKPEHTKEQLYQFGLSIFQKYKKLLKQSSNLCFKNLLEQYQIGLNLSNQYILKTMKLFQKQQSLVCQVSV